MSSSEEQLSDGESLEWEPGPEHEQPPTKKTRQYGSINVMSCKVVTVLDKCKISDRDAVHLVSALVETFGYNPAEMISSRSSIRRARQKLRIEKAGRIKTYFQGMTLDAAVVHFDGKLFPDDTGTGKHDRLAIIITSGDVDKLLSVPILPDSTGREQAKAVYSELVEWELTEIVKGLCCDTTSSNTGRINGACTNLEQMLERPLLYFMCRHHMYELYLEAAFESKIPHSPGPYIRLFVKFKEIWQDIDQQNFDTFSDEDLVDFQIDRSEILDFIETVLTAKKQPRDDYEEFLKLAKIILGETKGATFRAPGAFNHTRWMSKAIYSLKMYLFREQLDFTSEEEEKLKDVCVFIVKLYLKAWFTVPFAHKAPKLDLDFAKQVIKFKEIDSVISKAVMEKIKNHLWYFTSENAALALFDDEVSVDEKREMVTALAKENSSSASMKRVKLSNIYDLQSKNLCDFITEDSNCFFEWLELDDEFLGEDPADWHENEVYIKSQSIVKKIKVVNDTAERGVKLISEYENILTKNEAQKQSILQNVAEYRKVFGNLTKVKMSQEF